MKIIQVTPQYPPHSGGVETHVREISKRLVDRGHEVTVHTADRGSGVRTHDTQEGVEIRRHRGVAPGGAFHLAPGIAAAIQRADADLVHAHNYHSLPLFFAALSVMDERFVVTPHYHGESASGIRDRMLSLYRPFGDWALRRARAVVAVSEWERNRLREDFSIESTVIPNGLNIERFEHASALERERPYLLTVGRLEEYKGIQYVIRAIPELPEYDLLVAGSGPYREDLEALAQEVGVADRVEFLGYVPDEDLPGLYAGADAYVTLSAFEAYGMTVAEALGAGTACVVQEAGALTDWTDKGGVIGVSDVSSESVASTVENAVRNAEPEWTPPTWDDIVHQLLGVYA